MNAQLWIVAGLIGAVTAGIAVICVLWMRSTRASQHKTDQQNARIIELLEKISSQMKQ